MTMIKITKNTHNCFHKCCLITTYNDVKEIFKKTLLVSSEITNVLG